MNPNANYEFWVTMLCRCTFISCNKYTTFIGDVDNGKGYACLRRVYEKSLFSSQFCCELKTALKN